ncbi:MAG: hypothetical protein QM695_08235 [Micropruina sp.]
MLIGAVNVVVRGAASLVFVTQRLLRTLTDVAEVRDLYQRGPASTSRILALWLVQTGAAACAD